MKEFLLLLRDHGLDYNNFTQNEYESIIAKFNAWNRQLIDNQRVTLRGKLQPELGSTVRNDNGELYLDGPYSEAKEAVVGYYVILAKDYAEANNIAKGCPILLYNGSVEVRELENSEESPFCQA